MLNLIAVVVCTASAVACVFGRNQFGFIGCTALAAANGWIVYTDFIVGG